MITMSCVALPFADIRYPLGLVLVIEYKPTECLI